MMFTAEGREDGENPYFMHFYRVEAGRQRNEAARSGRRVARGSDGRRREVLRRQCSTVNTAPKSVLYDRAGALDVDLETVDLRR